MVTMVSTEIGVGVDGPQDFEIDGPQDFEFQNSFIVHDYRLTYCFFLFRFCLGICGKIPGTDVETGHGLFHGFVFFLFFFFFSSA